MNIQNSKFKTSSKARGFSLIEIVFAMFFLIVIIMGVINLQSSNLALINSQNNEIQAHFYANRALEIASDQSITGFGAGDHQFAPAASGYRLEAISAPSYFPELANDLYEVTVNIDPSGLVAGAFKLTANVSWKDSTGDHQITAKRIIF